MIPKPAQIFCTHNFLSMSIKINADHVSGCFPNFSLYLAVHARSEAESIGCNIIDNFRRYSAWTPRPVAGLARPLSHRRSHRHRLVGPQNSSRPRREKETAGHRRAEKSKLRFLIHQAHQVVI